MRSILSACFVALALGHDLGPDERLGCWMHGDREFIIRFDPSRVVVHTRDDPLRPSLNVYRVRYEGQRVVLWNGFDRFEWSVTVLEGTLTLAWPLWEGTFRRVDGVPPEVSLDPVHLGQPGELPPVRLAAIREDLRKRLQNDEGMRARLVNGMGQATRVEALDVYRVDTEHTEYLKDLIGEVGWIDSARFGRAAAQAAFLIVQHSGDLRLMLAALPEVEAELKAGNMDARQYALLFDRVRLRLAESQRYGTQILQSDKGDWVVAFLEDPDRVDEYRARLGLGRLAEYIELFKSLYGIESVEITKGED